MTNLNTLRDLGYIEWENRNDTSNLYTLVFSEGNYFRSTGVL